MKCLFSTAQLISPIVVVSFLVLLSCVTGQKAHSQLHLPTMPNAATCGEVITSTATTDKRVFVRRICGNTTEINAYNIGANASLTLEWREVVSSVPDSTNLAKIDVTVTRYNVLFPILRNASKGVEMAVFRMDGSVLSYLNQGVIPPGVPLSLTSSGILHFHDGSGRIYFAVGNSMLRAREDPQTGVIQRTGLTFLPSVGDAYFAPVPPAYVLSNANASNPLEHVVLYLQRDRVIAVNAENHGIEWTRLSMPNNKVCFEQWNQPLELLAGFQKVPMFAIGTTMNFCTFRLKKGGFDAIDSFGAPRGQYKFNAFTSVYDHFDGHTELQVAASGDISGYFLRQSAQKIYLDFSIQKYMINGKVLRFHSSSTPSFRATGAGSVWYTVQDTNLQLWVMYFDSLQRGAVRYAYPLAFTAKLPIEHVPRPSSNISPNSQSANVAVVIDDTLFCFVTQ